MSTDRPLTRWLLTLPRWAAVGTIVAASVGLSVVVTSLLPGIRAQHHGLALLIAAAVPLAVATPIGLLVVRLLHEVEQSRVAAQVLAYTDPLTGLLNRRRFFDLAGRTLARCAHDGQAAAALLLDLDDFKRINEGLGHVAGDAVLRHVAALCVDTVRPGDLVARWGGEEFAVLLPGAGGGDALAIATRLRDAVGTRPVPGLMPPLRVTASIGVATNAPRNDDLQRLLAAADAALVEAQCGGKNAARLAGPAAAGAAPA